MISMSGVDVTSQQRLLLTTEEVARMPRLDPSTLRRWRTACLLTSHVASVIAATDIRET
jgi:hypothetical protein